MGSPKVLIHHQQVDVWGLGIGRCYVAFRNKRFFSKKLTFFCFEIMLLSPMFNLNKTLLPSLHLLPYLPNPKYVQLKYALD